MCLPEDILSGSPCLLWLAADSGDENTFKMILTYLKNRDEAKKIPDPAPGGTTVLEIAFSKDHDKILKLALESEIWSANQYQRTLYPRLCAIIFDIL